MPTGNKGKARATQQARNSQTLLNQQMIDAIREMLGLDPLYHVKRGCFHLYKPWFKDSLGDGNRWRKRDR